MRVGTCVNEIILLDPAADRGVQSQHFVWDGADQRYEFVGFS